jgi:hypothetical protein
VTFHLSRGPVCVGDLLALYVWPMGRPVPGVVAPPPRFGRRAVHGEPCDSAVDVTLEHARQIVTTAALHAFAWDADFELEHVASESAAKARRVLAIGEKQLLGVLYDLAERGTGIDVEAIKPKRRR